ncbi:hypothetical protein ABID21_000915 [Pseudorhizobium tarimense]|uniref:Lipid A 3-O-deacylase (PagL) n=1 Tax=Pseudorhizobium tarimense TaxID=1079109 RepID=A0ABV2H301_9HYPH|nr:acyloxyacyl hydrolase [Pseudorhizobium tarimense]MCJ8518189.1 acyloxyacyl hydrolase [Pseudorhizobium tarimense]
MHKVILSTFIASAIYSTASFAADFAPAAPLEAHPVAHEAGRIFDEARFGVLTSIDHSGANKEDGYFITGMLLFDPWGYTEAQGFDRLLRPRIHVGGTVATEDEANQIYAGFSWTANVTDRFFLELGFGGTLHDGDLDVSDGGDGPELGCRALFHEYVAAGLNVTEKWSVIAHLEHSSHANLCDGPNNGLSRGGLMVGYKF